MIISLKNWRRSSKSSWLIISLILTAIFFWKIVMTHLIPVPGDLIVGAYYPWLNQKWGYSVGVPVKNPGSTDIISQFYPWRKLVVEEIKSGELPLWNRSYFMGTTLIGNIQAAIFNPFNIFYLLPLNFNYIWALQVMLQPFFVLLAMYSLLRSWKLSKLSSALGSIAYAFSGTMLVWVEYNVHGFIFAAFPLFLYLINQAYLKKNYRYYLGLPGLTAFIIFAGYPQLVYYILGFSFLYCLYLNFQRGCKDLLSSVLIYSLSIILGLGLSAVQLLPGINTLQNSIRDLDKVAQSFQVQTLPLSHLIMGVIPDFFGNPATYNYWGKGTYESFTFYTSVIVLILSAFSIKNNNLKQVKYLWIILWSSLLLSLSTPLVSFIQSLSFLGLKGSTAVRVLFVYCFAMSALGSFGLDNLKRVKNRYRVFILPGLLGLLALGILFFEKTGRNLLPGLHIAFRNTFWPLIMSIACALLIFFLKNRRILTVLLCLLIFIDYFRFGSKYLSFVPNDLIFPATPVINYLQSQPKPFRIAVEQAELLPANSWSPYDLENITGYDILVPKSTSEFISYLNYQESGKENARFVDIRDFNSKLLDVSDVKYTVVLNKGSDRSPELDSTRYEKVYEEKSVEVWENKNNLGRYFIAPHVRVSDPAHVYDDMISQDLQQTAVVEKDPKITGSGRCSIIVTGYTSQSSSLTTQCSDEALLVISDPYDTGWKALVNNSRAIIYKTNGRFMSIVLPQGDSTVSLNYQPDVFRYGIYLSLISLLLYVFLIPILGKNGNMQYTSRHTKTRQ